MIEVLVNAFPIHEQFNFPGHLDVVAGQLGEQRHAYGSTLNGYFHTNSERLKFLISKDRGGRESQLESFCLSLSVRVRFVSRSCLE